jgi:hypothetical protein
MFLGMRRKRLIALATVLLAAGVVAGAVIAAAARTPESNGVSRVERAIDLKARGVMDFDFGAIVPAFIPYTTPGSVESVDVTLTVTFRYRTTPGDAASFSAALNDDAPPPDTLSLPMRPSSFRVPGARSGNTVTLTWIRRDVPASGKEYVIHLFAHPIDRSGNRRAEVETVGAAAVVIESWTAGD